MRKTCKQQCFAFESVGGHGHLLWTQATLAHFFDSYESIAKQSILGFIDSTEAPFAHLANGSVTPVEQVIRNKQPGK